MRPINTSFTHPLGLERHLPPEDKDINIFALLNILLVVMGFFILNTRFLAAPGLDLDLPRITDSITSSVTTESVLTVTDSNLLLFNGRIYSFNTIKPALGESRDGKPSLDNVLLLKMDQQVSVATLLRVCEMAYQAGFSRVQIASLPAQAGSDASAWVPSTSFKTP